MVAGDIPMVVDSSWITAEVYGRSDVVLWLKMILPNYLFSLDMIEGDNGRAE